MKYKTTVEGILEYIGGINNLVDVNHCATRLRLKLKDTDLVNDEELKKVKAVLGVRIMDGNEIQIIIGTDVVNAYDDFMEMTGFDGKGDGNSTQSKEKKKWTVKSVGAAIVEYLSGTVAPVIPIYLGCGMLMAFINVLKLAGLVSDTSGIVVIFNAVSNAGFYFMPIVLGWVACTKLKADPALGAWLGMSLVYADINNVKGLEFLGISIPQIQYNGSFLPMILGAAFLAIVYRFFKDKIPQSCRYFLLPLVVLVICVPATLLVFGPLGYELGTGLMVMLEAVSSHFKLVAMAIWGFVTPLSIITGMDKAVYFLNMDHLNTVGFDNIFLPGGLAGNAAIGGAALAVWFLSKNSDTKQVGASSGITAIIGITEPALYGICLNFRTPLFGAMSGAAIGSVFAGVVNLKQFVYAGPGLVTSPVYINPNGSMTNFYFCLITIAVSAVAGFGMTCLLSRNKIRQYDGADAQIVETKEPIELAALCDGEAIRLSDVNDGVFSEGMMGNGIAFMPAAGKFAAPCNGTVTAVYDTGHAYGITTQDGTDILIHIGIDTVKLDGKGFDVKVKQGQVVARGQLLCEVDLEFLKEEGCRIETMMTVPNADGRIVETRNIGNVKKGATIVAIVQS